MTTSTSPDRKQLARILLPRVVLALAFVLWAVMEGGAARWLLLFLPVLIWDAADSVRHPAGRVRLPSERFRRPGNHRVVLQVAGPRPIAVIKQVRRTTGVPLAEARDLVRSAPVVLVEGISEQSAEHVTACLRDAGARATSAPTDGAP